MPEHRKVALRCRCGGEIDQVTDSRQYPTYIRRRRLCRACGERTTTVERLCRAPHGELPPAEVLDRALEWIEAQRCPFKNPERALRWERRRMLLLRLLTARVGQMEAA